MKFQSPDGDFVYSDLLEFMVVGPWVLVFQSPDGDFVYSDSGTISVTLGTEELFQSPDGDFVYSDECFGSTDWRGRGYVSIP